MAKGSAWTKFATDVYRREKAKNPDFKFKNALKMAAKEYKGGAGSKLDQSGGMGSGKGLQEGGMGEEKSQAGGKRRGSYKKRSQKRKSSKRKSRGRRSRRYNKK